MKGKKKRRKKKFNYRMQQRNSKKHTQLVHDAFILFDTTSYLSNENHPSSHVLLELRLVCKADVANWIWSNRGAPIKRGARWGHHCI